MNGRRICSPPDAVLVAAVVTAERLSPKDILEYLRSTTVSHNIFDTLFLSFVYESIKAAAVSRLQYMK